MIDLRDRPVCLAAAFGVKLGKLGKSYEQCAWATWAQKVELLFNKMARGAGGKGIENGDLTIIFDLKSFKKEVEPFLFYSSYCSSPAFISNINALCVYRLGLGPDRLGLGPDRLGLGLNTIVDKLVKISS